MSAMEWLFSRMVRKIIPFIDENRRIFGKVSCFRVDSANPANVLSVRENIQYGRTDRKAGRLVASRQQHLPVRRAFRLFCAAFTCLLLLISSLQAPAVAGSTVKLLRYGTLKTSGYSTAAADRDCRQRAVAGKVTFVDSGVLDLFCPPPGLFHNPIDADGFAAIVAPFGSGTGRMETRGARAPPPGFT